MARPSPLPPEGGRAYRFAGLQGFEQTGLLLCADTDAGVAHAKVQQAAVVLLAYANAQFDLAVGGELDGIAGEVGEDLLQPVAVSEQASGDLRVDLDQQLEVALTGLQGHQGGHVADQLVQLELAGAELQAAGFDLGEVENVVDHGQQRFAGIVQHVQVLALGAVELGAFEQLGDTQHAIHRRADFVAHVGEELALGAIGLLGHDAQLIELVLCLDFVADVVDLHDQFVGIVLAGQARHRDMGPERLAVAVEETLVEGIEIALAGQQLIQALT